MSRRSSPSSHSTLDPPIASIIATMRLIGGGNMPDAVVNGLASNAMKTARQMLAQTPTPEAFQDAVKEKIGGMMDALPPAEDDSTVVFMIAYYAGMLGAALAYGQMGAELMQERTREARRLAGGRVQ